MVSLPGSAIAAPGLSRTLTQQEKEYDLGAPAAGGGCKVAEDVACSTRGRAPPGDLPSSRTLRRRWGGELRALPPPPRARAPQRVPTPELASLVAGAGSEGVGRGPWGPALSCQS